MARKKKKTKETPQPENQDPTEGRYYWCVNCGHHGDYGSVRKRSLKCEECNYEDVCIHDDILKDPETDWISKDRFVKSGVKATTESIKEVKEISVADRLAAIRAMT